MHEEQLSTHTWPIKRCVYHVLAGLEAQKSACTSCMLQLHCSWQLIQGEGSCAGVHHKVSKEAGGSCQALIQGVRVVGHAPVGLAPWAQQPHPKRLRSLQPQLLL